MTTHQDGDDDLAPVTDLFGARTRRRPVSGSSPVGSAVDGADARPDATRPADPVETGAWDGADADPDAGVHDAGVYDADAPVPLHGARPQAEWLSPVVGDDSGRSARAEQQGYDDDHTADAATASVFAIHDGSEIDPADAPRPLDEQRADAERISMRSLGRKGVSTSEMRTTLTKQDLDPDVVEGEIDRLTRVGLLDDVALATDLVDRLHERKGLGRQGVVTELRRRGIDQAAIYAALDAATSVSCASYSSRVQSPVPAFVTS